MKKKCFSDSKAADFSMSEFFRKVRIVFNIKIMIKCLFIKKENITVCGKQGGTLEGNSTRKFLKKVDRLADHLASISGDVLQSGQPFLQTLDALNHVVHNTFGGLLQDGWEASIANFSQCYMALKNKLAKSITITPKVTNMI